MGNDSIQNLKRSDLVTVGETIMVAFHGCDRALRKATKEEGLGLHGILGGLDQGHLAALFLGCGDAEYMSGNVLWAAVHEDALEKKSSCPESHFACWLALSNRDSGYL